MKGLPLFDEFGVQKYVSTILGHAGVPNRSMTGFVEGFIQPAVEFDLDAEEAIADLNNNDQKQISSSYMLHKGVRDYLRTGGKVSVDFVDRCLQVIKENERPFYEKYRGYLPRRILKKFEEIFSQEVSEKMTKREKLQSPLMKLDPFLDGVYLKIPIQRLSLSQVNQSCVWKIYKNNQLVDTIDCDIILLSRSKQYELIPIIKRFKLIPKQEYQIGLEIDGQIYRKWHFETKAALLFDASTRKSISKNLLHNGTYWILIDREYSISEESEKFHDVITEPMFDEWGEYVFYEISPQQNHRIIFTKLNENIDIYVFAEKDHPKFMDSEETMWGGEVPTFVTPPTLCIPLSTYPDFRNELEKWTLKITHDQNTKRDELEMAHYKSHIKIVGNYYEFNLADLGIEFSEGKYELRLLGRLEWTFVYHLSFCHLP